MSAIDGVNDTGKIPCSSAVARLRRSNTMLGPLEIHCEAPPYGMVRACEDAGFLSPLDVPWRQLRSVLTGEEHDDSRPGLKLWRRLFGKSKLPSANCHCGEPLPELKSYAVTFKSNWVGDYRLVQCSRCRTIFWDLTLPVQILKEEIARGAMEN
jgi:hypothetical protein